jgi:hypothetical protein
MEIVGGVLASLVLMVLLAGVGLASVIAFGLMALLGLLTEMSFRRVFFISFGLGLLAPLLLGGAVVGALQDGSLQRDLRDGLGEYVQLPDDMGEQWRETLPKLQEVSRDVDRGNLTEEEAERRVEQILSEIDDLRITIDVDGDGLVVGDRDSGVPLELPAPAEPVPADGDPDSDPDEAGN